MGTKNHNQKTSRPTFIILSGNQRINHIPPKMYVNSLELTMINLHVECLKLKTMPIQAKLSFPTITLLNSNCRK